MLTVTCVWRALQWSSVHLFLEAGLSDHVATQLVVLMTTALQSVQCAAALVVPPRDEALFRITSTYHSRAIEERIAILLYELLLHARRRSRAAFWIQNMIVLSTYIAAHTFEVGHHVIVAVGVCECTRLFGAVHLLRKGLVSRSILGALWVCFLTTRVLGLGCLCFCALDAVVRDESLSMGARMVPVALFVLWGVNVSWFVTLHARVRLEWSYARK